MADNKSQIQNLAPANQSFFFMYFVKYIQKIQLTESQNTAEQILKLKISVFKTTQILNSLRDPIQIRLHNGWVKPSKLELSFLSKDNTNNRNVNYALKIQNIKNNQIQQLGEINIQPNKYIQTLVQQGINKTEQQQEFNKYRFTYLIFVDQNRHNLEKIVKAYKNSQGYLNLSPEIQKTSPFVSNQKLLQKNQQKNIKTTEFEQKVKNNEEFQLLSQQNKKEVQIEPHLQQTQVVNSFQLKNEQNQNNLSQQYKSKKQQQVLNIQNQKQQSIKQNQTEPLQNKITEQKNEDIQILNQNQELIKQQPKQKQKRIPKQNKYYDRQQQYYQPPKQQQQQTQQPISHARKQQKQEQQQQNTIIESKILDRLSIEDEINKIQEKQGSQLKFTFKDSKQNKQQQKSDEFQNETKAVKVQSIYETDPAFVTKNGSDWKLTLKILIVLILLGLAFVYFGTDYIQNQVQDPKPTISKTKKTKQSKKSHSSKK